MLGTDARYDGQADWYETRAANWVEPNRAPLRQLFGDGGGRCLDLGCGQATYADIIRSTGRKYVGCDFSADQLSKARQHEGVLVQADAMRLPFRDDAFAAVAAIWVSTDIDSFATVTKEAVRVLEPGGLFVFYGVHPCFNGPCVEWHEDGSRTVHPNYREAGWHDGAPWWSEDGIRSRVGMRHVPLADLFTSIIAAGLELTQVIEPREDPIPNILGIAARSPA